AIHRNLLSKGYSNFVLKTFHELDLTRQADVEAFFEKEKPDYVFLAAAKVGGIIANNTYRAQFIYENLMIQNNIVHAAYKCKVKKLLFLGSSCIYPKNASQPLKEEYLLTGILEETNEPYAIAKIAGIKMCESYFRQYGSNFISVMPTNLYGQNDNYDLEKSHVLPALIRQMHLGKSLEQNDWQAIRIDLNKRPIEGITGEHDRNEIQQVLDKYGVTLDQPIANSQQPIASVELWGTGKVYREFLYVDDMADACVYIMENVEAEKLYQEMKQTHINIGTGIDLTIKDLAELVKKTVGFNGNLTWDHTKPDGTAKKQLDVSLLHSLGWQPKIALEAGIGRVYSNYLQEEN
ncbi:MAG: GDP-L-fucose synthase, partial [Ignavibacteria bacterium]|nr:GDP-L-fucose synthase [Ignavibacteria bacterium]